jgi:hypothetical protein
MSRKDEAGVVVFTERADSWYCCFADHDKKATCHKVFTKCSQESQKTEVYGVLRNTLCGSKMFRIGKS